MRLAAAVSALLVAATAAPAFAADFAGTWDLTWQTRRGPSKSGWLVIRQEGERLTAEIHGKGNVRASGTAQGDAFVLRGSKMGAPYTISGRLEGDQLVGSLRVLSVEKKFVGDRRK